MSDQALTVKSTKKTIKDYLQSDDFKLAVAKSLPKHCTPERFTRVALTALMRVPKLAECTQESLFRCMLDLSALGLEPDSRRAHLIPFRDNKTNTTVCTLIVDYKGIVELVRRSGEVVYIHADVVGENDEFDYAFGSGAFLKHKPAFSDRGKIKCAYSFVRLKDGSEDFDVMGVDEIEKVRNRSRSGNNGPWVTDWNEMAKKTVFRRHSKWLPLSYELRSAIEKDDEPLTEQERFAAAKPVFDKVSFLPAPADAETAATESEPAPETEAPKSAEPSAKELAETIRASLERHNINEQAFMSFLVARKMAKVNQVLGALPVAKLADLLAGWDEVIQEYQTFSAEATT